MRVGTGIMPIWWKQIVLVAGGALLLPGVLVAMANACVVLILMAGSGQDAPTIGMATFAILLMTLGAGGVMALHASRSLRGKPSGVLRMPQAWWMAGIFVLCLAAGVFVHSDHRAEALLFPPLLFISAAIPPLLAVAWFAQGGAEGLTFRRGMVAFACGATFSVIVALVLEVILPVIVLVLVFNLGTVAMRSVHDLLSDLAGQQIARAITNPGFIYAFIQLAIIAPFAEEIAKPLATLPLIGRLGRRDAFLVAAMAGAGFATLENVLYTSFGAYLWSGVLVVRAIGGAIHPLGAGLVGLSWRELLNGERESWRFGLARFGIAVGMHALWNGGSLLVITLAGAQFFGKLPPEINILGWSAAGTLLALLIVLGLAALWLGRAVVQRTRLPFEGEADSSAQFVLSDRAIALWGLACLVAIVPVGVTALRLLLW
jgi:RsiW-degrading membrane proteinase PrsW (M82 family)